MHRLSPRPTRWPKEYRLQGTPVLLEPLELGLLARLDVFRRHIGIAADDDITHIPKLS